MEIAYFDQMNGTNLMAELDLTKLGNLEQALKKVGNNLDNAVKKRSTGSSKGSRPSHNTEKESKESKDKDKPDDTTRAVTSRDKLGEQPIGEHYKSSHTKHGIEIDAFSLM